MLHESAVGDDCCTGYTHCSGFERLHYIVSQKGDTILLSISLLNIDRFSQFFHWRTQLELCNKIINKDPTSPCENRSIFSKDMDKSIVSPFLTHGEYGTGATARGNVYTLQNASRPFCKHRNGILHALSPKIMPCFRKRPSVRLRFNWACL